MGEGWRLGVVQTPPAWSGGGVLGASEGVRRVLLEPKIVPARTRELDRARAAKKAAKNAAAAADAGSSEPPPWRSAGGDGGGRRPFMCSTSVWDVANSISHCE